MTETILTPMFNRVIMKQVVVKKSAQGLIMAPAGQKSADRAEVLAVGPGMYNTDTGKFMPVDLKVGDIVLINAYLGMRATVDGQDVIIQKDEEILAKETSK